MGAKVVFNQFVHQSGNRAAHGSDEVERVSTRRIGHDTPFNRGNLSGDAVDARDKLVTLTIFSGQGMTRMRAGRAWWSH